MSGVNWIPPWALGGSDGDDRFRVVSGGRVVSSRAPQLVHRCGDRRRPGSPGRGGRRRPRRSRRGLGVGSRQRELQLCRSRRTGRQRAPGSRASARRSAAPTRRRSSPSGCTWKTSKRIAGSGRAKPPTRAISSRCTATRSTLAGPTVRPTTELLPFLARVTRWLGDGRDVLFSEFGLPTYRRDDPHEQRRRPSAAGRGGGGGRVHGHGAGGASSRRLSRRIALVLLRLRPSAVGEPALRSRSPRAHASGSGEPTAHRNRRSPPSQRSSAPNGAPPETPTRGSTSTGTSSVSTRVRSCPRLYRRYLNSRGAGAGSPA